MAVPLLATNFLRWVLNLLLYHSSLYSRLVPGRSRYNDRCDVGEETILFVSHVGYLHRHIDQRPFGGLLILRRRYAIAVYIEDRERKPNELSRLD